MIVTISQPAYLPWLGYFDKIKNSDVYVFFDTVPMGDRSFSNRNKIKTPQGPKWLTIPVKTGGDLRKSLIKDVETASDTWQKSHWFQIMDNYKKAPFWNEYSPELELFYQKPYTKLSDVCWDMLQILVKAFDLKTRLVRSSDLPVFSSQKDYLLLDILKHVGADHYISGAMGKDYIHEEAFREAGISLSYQEYAPQKYQQLFGEFIPCLAAIDLLFNEGPKSISFI